ncbi:uncharacterized protein PGTG_08158 [Puccinia graminis f. sp. tritici CRL 75-36-700-3]|uniref:Uncharacterized protein n=1 Tax=Puccinia graminis f. sp. tritici (strain CRL 75-36-700-3 / race SCCL) TaxID=418459 RepID=E3KCG1_PUCGT|nr:uncharacterized protein PGTG_08158 [Puccinia graminis f. sp. tritici CRL 75-36-700-3]EFP81909.1 hypothetical protein PGTG_08158 [Puccinia graminis f. sp. tritici CRL 75-36-700-3]
MDFVVQGSGVICPLNFSGVVKLLSKETSFDYDKGTCNVYLVKVPDLSSTFIGDDNVYREGAKFIQTIVAPCLDDLGVNLTLLGKYELKGLIIRDDACGTTWEFNPLLARISKKLDHLKVSGSGCIATVNLALAADKDGHGQDEILVNNAPSDFASLIQLRLIVNIRHWDTI